MKTKVVSQLDVEGYYVGPTIADESPLEPDVFLFPGGAVDLTPPSALAEGKRYKPVDGGWVAEDIPVTEPDTVVELTPEQLQVQANAEARRYLLSTDWYVIRKSETGAAIPQDILDARQAARTLVIE